jgi:antitoxin component of RelBE/YafQ-DinJ toxin-antitoxin module
MKSLINVKADKDVKEKAQKLAKRLGVPLSVVINAYLHEFIRSEHVDISLVPRRLSPKVEADIKKALLDYKHKRNIAGPFSTSKEMDAYLDS